MVDLNKLHRYVITYTDKGTRKTDYFFAQNTSQAINQFKRYGYTNVKARKMKTVKKRR